MSEEELNEFESLDEEAAPEQEFSGVPDQGETLVDAGPAGQTYDWTKAPEGVKAPPRIDLDGKETILKKADIILPPPDKPWEKTKAGDKDFKYCTFILFYDVDGQQEYYSGVRVFKRDGGKYSHPTVTRDRKNQASRLLGLYADFKAKDINEVNLREFMGFLNSQPKVRIKSEGVTNPQTGESIKKNFVGEFVK